MSDASRIGAGHGAEAGDRLHDLDAAQRQEAQVPSTAGRDLRAALEQIEGVLLDLEAGAAGG